MRSAIYGAGSLGTVMGAFLAKNGVEIDLVNRNKAHVEALKNNGARITGTVEMTVPVNALLPEEMTGRYDIIFLMTKQLNNRETLSFLKERLDSVSGRGWFAPGARILSEAAVIGPDGREYRPDRVVVHPDGNVDVVDYKFGSENPSYHRQVQRYMNLYRQMGHAKVAGYLWYLEDNFITFVG